MEDLGIDKRIILKWIFKKYDLGKYWIELAKEMATKWVVVNAVMNRRVT